MKSFYKDIVVDCLRKGEQGSFSLSDSGSLLIGTRDPFSDLIGHIDIHDESVYRSMALGGDVGLGDSYAAGKWDSDDLTALLRWLVRNRASIAPSNLGYRGMLRLAVTLARNAVHFTRLNTRGNSKKNIHAHYDLGNAFFEAFLDDSMTYSSAFFAYDGQPLEEAQNEKYDRICRKLDLKEGESLLEIGCGWGGFAIYAAERYGCYVTATTISQEQFAEARKRVADRGLEERIEIELTDYRELKGEYEKIASIEMIEAVGHSFLETYFGQIDRLLCAEGLACVQVITCPGPLYRSYLKNADYIQRRIFPGSHLPSLRALLRASEKGGSLETMHIESFGLHYAETLKQWRERFEGNWPRISEMGFDEAFYRKWRFYLGYCEAGFLERHVNVSQLTFGRPDERGYRFERSLPEEVSERSADERIPLMIL